MARIVEVTVDDQVLDASHAARLKPGQGRIQFRYAGVYLRAPERVRYFYRLEGLEPDWIPAGGRRLIDFNPLPHGSYRFAVRAMIPGGGVSEAQFAFEVLPRFYETRWFILLCGISLAGIAYGLHQLRLKQIGARYAMVFEERARLAREIHDTLAQGFVGISHQLDALAIVLNQDLDVARQHLSHARKMVRHSLTEARRSMMDLRSTEFEAQDLSAALAAAAQRWVAGSRVEVQLEVSAVERKLPADLEQNLLRIAQEAVANAVKHATAHVIKLELSLKDNFLMLRVKDDGKGFEPADTFSVSGGHFGIVGMRERTERLGGKFDLASQPGTGTLVEVKVPLASRNSRIG
jgi:signal transduction histidine kinase